MNHPHHLQFHLDTDPAHFNERLEEMLAAIGHELQDHNAAHKILSKMRWILTELITNAYKHSGQTGTMLYVHFNPGEISVIKEDSGRPLNISLPDGEHIEWPLRPGQCNREINIYQDHLSILNGRVDDSGAVSFYVQEREAPDFSAIQNMNEHFGLIIITSACDEFTYQFEATKGKNIFTSVIRPDLL